MMARTTLEQWRMVQAVAEYGGFMQAAEQVHKSQSSVHHAVNKMEQQLGVKLFEVEGRKTTLTEAGKQLLRRINYLLAETERFENVAQNLSAGVESKLVLAVDEAFPKDLLFEALVQVAAEYPLVHIELLETILTGANELLSQGVAQLSISPFTLANQLSEDLCTVEFIAVCGVDHPLARLPQVSLEDLKACRQIVLRDSGKQRKSENGWLGSEQRWTVTHVATSLALIERNQGFAWLPASAVQASLAQGRVVPIQLQRGARRSNTFYLNFEDAETLGPVARSLIGHIRFLTLAMSR